MPLAKSVKGFSLYPSYREFLALLSDTDRGQLLMSLFDSYEGINSSSSLTPQAQMAFTFISARMEQDKGHAEYRSQVGRENATKRWPRREETTDATEDG